MRSKQSFTGNASCVFTHSALKIKIGVALCASLLLSMAGLGNVAHAQTAASSVVKLLLQVNKYAGTGTPGETGVGGQASAATLTLPSGLGFDGTGNVYISDFQTNVIHKVDNFGILTTVAGGGTAPTTCAGSTDAYGDGCLATQAVLAGPYVIAVDRAGNIFLTDQQHRLIREVVAATGVIQAIVGGGPGAFYKGTAAVAGTSVAIYNPDGIAIDANDDVFFSDSADSIIYKATPTGTGTYNVAAYVGAVAIAGYSGDGGQSYNAQVSQPIGLAVDSNGNLFIADQANNRIRKVTAAGVISTVAGTGGTGYAGDGGTAMNAVFYNPRSVAIDYAGDLLISDSQNLVVRIIYADPTTKEVVPSSYIETLAGSGAACPGGVNPCGDGGLAINATFAQNAVGNGGSTQFGFDVPRGNFYISDLADNRVRSLAPSTTFPTTPAGSTSTSTVGLQLVGGVAATISSISIAPGPTGTAEFSVTGIAGQPANVAEGTPALACSTNGATPNVPGTICNLTVNFTPQYPGNQTAQLKVVTSQGTFIYGLNGVGTSPLAVLSPAPISTFVGTGVGGYTTGPQATAARINGPTGSFFDGAGNYYFADQANQVIRKVTPAGVISVVAGTVGAACPVPASLCGDGGLATAANLGIPHGAVVDAAGNIYIADTGDSKVRRVDGQTGIISTVAGTGTPGFNGDGGLGTAALLNQPQAVALDPAGNLYIADSNNNEIRIISSGSLYIFPYAGTGVMCPMTTAACGDGGSALTANLNLPVGMAFDAAGNLVFADTDDNRIRLVSASTGFISTVAGTGTSGHLDNVAATMGQFNLPAGVVIDPGGNYYIPDFVNSAVRRVDATTKILTTIIGNFVACTVQPCGDGGPASAAQLIFPNSIALDQTGNVVVDDYGANTIRKISAGSANLNFATTQVNLTSTDSPKTETLQNIGNAVLTLGQPTTGTNASISTGFTQGNTQTCPQLTASTGTLNPGMQCSYSISFTPTMVGNITGALIETDNSLNVAGSTQTVTLNGIGIADMTTDTLVANPNPSTFGQPVTLTYTVPTVGGVPATGTVTCTVAGQTVTGTLNASGVATIPVTGLPVGTNQPVNCSYGGSATYAPGTGATTVTVGVVPATNDTFTALPGTTVSGSPVTLKFTVVPPAGSTPITAPTGTVTFTGPGGYNSGPITVVNGVATVPTSTLPVGTNETLTAVYTGDGNYAGTTLTATVTVTAKSGTDTVVANPNPATFGQPVTLTYTVPTVGGVPATGTVTCTVAGQTVTGTLNASGVATIPVTGLPVGTNQPVNCSYGGNSTYAPGTGTTTVTVGVVPATNDTFTALPGTTVSGSPVTLTFTVVPPAGSTPGTAPTGTVTFTGPGGYNSGLIAVVNGVATVPTSTLPVGTSETLTAVYTGDGNYAGTTLTALVTVTARTGTDTVVANPNPSTFGQPITLTYTVPTVGGVPATGTVTCTVGGQTVTGTLNASGVATIPVSNLPVGTNQPVNCSYGGNSTYAPATATTTVTVGVVPATNDTFTALPGTTVSGSPVTLTFTVVPPAGTTPNTAPTGTVTFTGPGGYNSGLIAVVNGVATVPTSTLPVGTNETLTAVYTGDGNYAGTTLTTTVTVTAKTSTDTVTPNPNPSTYGQTVTLSYTVPTVGGVPATGTVTCTLGGQTVTGTLNASGVATIPVIGLPVGTNQPVNCSYGGSSTYAPGTATTTVTVGVVPATNDTFTALPGTTVSGSPVTLTFTVVPPAGSTPNAAPTGTVTFTGPGGYNSGPIAVVNGVATVPTSTLPVGTNETLTAVYTGDGNYAGTTLTTTVTVTAKTSTDTVTPNPNPSTYGQTVTLSYTVPTVGGVPATGTVTCTLGGQTVTGTLNASGVATIPVMGLPVGTNQPVNCSYGGNSTYAPATATTTVTVGVVPATNDTFTALPGTTVSGSPVTLTFTVVPPAGSTPNAAPTGTVTFTGPGGYNSGPIAVVNGVATVPTSTLPVGTNETLTAVYTGDGNYAGTTLTTTVTVTAKNGTDTLVANPNPSIYGQPVTLTYTVPTVGGVPATGTVTCTVAGQTVTGTLNASGVATIPVTGLPVGTNQPVNCTYSGNSTYAPGTGTTTVTVNPATPISIVTTNPGPYACGTPITLTDTLSPVVNATPFAGTVSFYYTVNGGAPILIGTVAVTAGGVATLPSTPAIILPCGVTSAIYAVFTPGPGSPYNPITSPTVPVSTLISDFSIVVTPPNQIVNPGDTTTYTVSLSGVGAAFASPVTLTATGLPPGATVKFGTPTYVPGVGPTSTTMTITTAPNQAMLRQTTGWNGIAYGLLLLPLLGVRRVRRKLRALPKSLSYGLAALLLLGGLGAVTGCGGGYFGPNAQTFSITVTGTSGTLVHSTGQVGEGASVTLTVR